MIVRIHYRVVLVLFVFLLGYFSFFDERQVASQQASSQNGIVIFCVSSFGNSGETYMEPVVKFEGGKYTPLVAGDSDSSVLTEFAKNFYGVGQKYQLLFGGGLAGHVTVEKTMMDSECFRAGAKIKPSAMSFVKLNRNVMALATNLGSLGRARAFRRAPTVSERAEASRLARKAFVEKGSPAALLSTLEVVNLTATDLDGDGKAELIGTFVLKKNKGGAARYVMFVIAEPQGAGYRVVLANYERFTNKDIMSGGSLDSVGAEGIYTERLVDQLDLDADRTGEVFTVTNSFESVTYKMYKKEAGMWKSVYEFNSYRCGF